MTGLAHDLPDRHAGGGLFQDRGVVVLLPQEEPPVILAIINNSEVAKSCAVTEGLYDVFLNPISLLDLHLRMVSLHASIAQRDELIETRRVAKEASSNAVYFHKLAYQGRLTGLPNRLALQEWASRRMSSSEIILFAYQLLDLDGFKAVNDQFRHHVGDELLKKVAERLSKVSRHLDFIARIGGDEIAIFQMDAKTADDCVALARRILDALSKPFEIQNRTITITAGISSALYPADAKSLDELMHRADSAMYSAKTS